MERKEKRTGRKFLADSPWLWGALALVAGAAGSVSPTATLGWIFFAAWLAASIAFIRHLPHGGRLDRIASNIVLSALIGFGLYRLQIVIIKSLPPSPPSPPTAAQIYYEFCRRSPWLCGSTIQAQNEPQFTPQEACHLQFHIAAGGVARLYGRHEIPTTTVANLSIDFQELFYEWNASLIAAEPINHLTVKINHLTEADIVTVIPASQTLVSEATPGWFSGFREPARTKPDYHSRVITIDALAKGDKAAILLRRALDRAEVAPEQVVRIDDARTNKCSLPPNKFEEKMAAKKVNGQLQGLANFRWGQVGGPPRALPLRHDPGDVEKNEVQATVEARCKNPTCTQLNVGRLEVHAGKVPERPVTVTVGKQR